ncbi:MAG: hypothetical protein LBK60_12805, partial [Verrucomicrobiales bacterium]|nr:hypothetical protein [Verrucomicrobiales bacterium]
QQPKIKVPVTARDWFNAIGAWLVFAIVLFYGLHVYSRAPRQIPIRFDWLGHPVAGGDKTVMLWLLGIVSLCFIGLGVACPFPHRFNYAVKITDANAERQYKLAVTFLRELRLATLALFMIILCSIERHYLRPWILYPMIACMIFLIGRYIYRSLKMR